MVAELRLEDHDHIVHFYRWEDEVVRSVGSHLVEALLDGDAVVVIAVPGHREALESELGAAGIDADSVRAEGRLELLDAADTLDGILVEGAPDGARFRAHVGDVLRSAALRGRVRVYGEMVGLLWEAGNLTGAISLERLWNELAAHLQFSLYCSYPALTGAGAEDAEAYAELCELHSWVVGGAPAVDGAERSKRFPGSPAAARAARHFVVDALQAWERDDLVDDGALVAAELASNAVIHGGADFTVGLFRRGRSVRLVVGDASATLPRPRELSTTALDGRGLRLVTAAASRWGHRLVDGGKLVWADLGGGPAL